MRVIVDQHDAIGRWIAARTGENWVTGQGTAIGFARDELIAGVSYYGFNGRNIWSSVAADDPRWCNRMTLWAIFSYPFEQLGCERMTALVDGSNVHSQRFVQKLGYTLEATLTDAAPDGDQHIFVMWKDDCRWLRNQRFKGTLNGQEIERQRA